MTIFAIDFSLPREKMPKCWVILSLGVKYVSIPASSVDHIKRPSKVPN